MHTSSRKVHEHANVIGELEQQPARVVSLLLDRVHAVVKSVVGDAGLDVVTDEFTTGQSPLLVLRAGHTPSIQGLGTETA